MVSIKKEELKRCRTMKGWGFRTKMNKVMFEWSLMLKFGCRWPMVCVCVTIIHVQVLLYDVLYVVMYICTFYVFPISNHTIA